jgi:hypothetical protein
MRKRRACLLCTKVDVMIEAVGITSEIDPNNAPVDGRPVAHMINLDDKKTEKYYGLRPQAQADYYLWVDRKPGTTRARWTLLEVSHTANMVLAGEPTDLNYCHKYTVNPANASDADFANERSEGPCNVLLPPTAAMTRMSLWPDPLMMVIERAVAALKDFAKLEGGWIYCSNGCCT